MTEVKMPRKILMITIALAGLYSSSMASIFVGTHNRSFTADTLFDDDIFITGNKVRFESQVSGDLIGACQEMVISGQIRGNVNLAARNINIIGPIDNSFRGFAQNIEINSGIHRNLIAFAQSVNMGPGAEIGSDANIFAGQVTFEGKIGKKLTVYAEKVTIAGTVIGDLVLHSENIEIRPNAIIEGDFRYTSPEEIKIPAGASIKGKTIWKKVEKGDEGKKFQAFKPITFAVHIFLIFNFIFGGIIYILTLILGNAILIPIMFLALIFSGIVTLALTRRRAVLAIDVMRKRPLVATGLGLLIILLFPIVTALAMLTLIGIPLAALMIFGFGILLFIGFIYTSVYIGSWLCRMIGIKKKEPSFVCFITGSILLTLLSLTPILGWIIVVVTLMFGSGAIILSLEKFKAEIAKIDELDKPQIA